MGAVLKVLIALGSLVGFPSMACAAGPLCLACHPSHYEASGSCLHCHGGDERTRRKNVAHRRLIPGAYAHFNLPNSPHVERGRGLVKTFGCRRCHVSGGEGNGLATDLDDVLFVSIAERVADVIRFPAMYMPNFHFSEGQIQDLVNALLAKGGGRDPQRKATPTVVHFEEQGRRDEIPFVKHCGPCHKLLASRYGGLGRGDIGPNLSGLFTEHYPRAFMEGPPWSPEKVRDWLKNPRAIRPLATMQPVALTPEEFHAVCSTILLDSGGLGAHPEASGFGPIFLESPSVAPPSGRGVPQGGRTSQ